MRCTPTTSTRCRSQRRWHGACGCGSIYDAHELYPEISTLSPREASVWRFVERRLAKRADHLVTVCDSIAVEIERRNGVVRPTVLLNCPPAAVGLAEADGDEDEMGSMLRNRAGLDGSGDPIVLYQGGFAPTADCRAWSARQASWSGGRSC